MSGAFADRFPFLFHVTDRAALPGIACHGLLSAAALCWALEVPERRAALLLSENRAAWTVLSAAGPGTVDAAPGTVAAALRRQGMGDGALATRLAPGLDPASWRRAINGRVFLFASERDAWRLRAAEKARDQVVLRFATAELAAAGLALSACRFNNGFVDRSPPGRRRLRGLSDYVPLAAWEGGTPREVTVEAAIPPGIAFRVLSPAA